jgi:hypothetical protein
MIQCIIWQWLLYEGDDRGAICYESLGVWAFLNSDWFDFTP